MIHGIHVEDENQIFKLNLPKARKPKVVKFDEKCSSTPNETRKLIQQAVNDRRQVFMKRAMHSPTIYIHRYEPLALNNDFRKMLSKHPFPFFQGPVMSVSSF